MKCQISEIDVVVRSWSPIYSSSGKVSILKRLNKTATLARIAFLSTRDRVERSISCQFNVWLRERRLFRPEYVRARPSLPASHVEAPYDRRRVIRRQPRNYPRTKRLSATRRKSITPRQSRAHISAVWPPSQENLAVAKLRPPNKGRGPFLNSSVERGVRLAVRHQGCINRRVFEPSFGHGVATKPAPMLHANSCVA